MDSDFSQLLRDNGDQSRLLFLRTLEEIRRHQNPVKAQYVNEKGDAFCRECFAMNALRNIEEACYKNTMFIDSHCHLEMEAFDHDREAVIETSVREGLVGILTVGTEEKYFGKVVELVDKHPAIYGALGIHPHNSGEFTSAIADVIRTHAKHPKIVGYGEVGLDFFKNYSAKAIQVRAFMEQLELATELLLPVIVHSRNAEEETVRMLKDSHCSGSAGVIHCYSYDTDCAKQFLDMGFYISIPGTITYKNNADLTEVVKFIPDDRILAETDAPFLAPHPYRGKRNAPYLVKLTVERMAQIRETSTEALASVIHDNFHALFLKNRQRKG